MENKLNDDQILSNCRMKLWELEMQRSVKDQNKLIHLSMGLKIGINLRMLIQLKNGICKLHYLFSTVGY